MGTTTYWFFPLLRVLTVLVSSYPPQSLFLISPRPIIDVRWGEVSYVNLLYEDNCMIEMFAYNPKVEVLDSTTDPLIVVNRACANNMKGKFAGSKGANPQLPKFLYTANHHSPLEFANITFKITQISRACGDQLMRHRIGSFSSSSQHYQDHSKYPFRVHLAGLKNENLKQAMYESFTMAINQYIRLQFFDLAYEEARQVLPMATEVSILWSVNARSLMNFLNLRLCYRNTIEMILLAKRVHLVSEAWFPELFNHVHADCKEPQGCKQGKMNCAVTGRLGQVDKYFLENAEWLDE